MVWRSRSQVIQGAVMMTANRDNWRRLVADLPTLRHFWAGHSQGKVAAAGHEGP